MQLYLVRHARADERGPQYPDDSKRPLVEKGFKQAKTLAKLFRARDVQFDYIFSSPYTRAAQTAEPLSKLGAPKITYLNELADDDYDLLLSKVASQVRSEVTVALVGHEPFMSELAAYLLTGQASVPAIYFRKGAAMQLQGEAAPGKMLLAEFIPAAAYKHLG